MKQAFFLFTIIAFITSCSSSKKFQKTTENTSRQIVNLDSLVIRPKADTAIYHASEKRVHDLIHTRLEVSFDYSKSQLIGKATLTLKPYFYNTDRLRLDARGFELKEVMLVSKNSKSPLKYKYENNVIDIDLGKVYTKADTFIVFIDYIAKPNELELGGSDAISSDKGLYFINPDRKDPNKPRQIWTQGETQASSAWFPTIDSPNEKMTDEIFITAEKNDITLSNGIMVSSKDNGNGTHTDYWKMDMPHAPYLVMMAISEFAVIKDKWKNKEVNYYVEKDYEQHAKAIFGKTPKMIEFYSKILGVDYPWQKYSQVVVRDYVSGAMENTTATLHGEFLNQTKREMIDGNNDDIIAHELFHQWFGDLVTCESWSNLPLNESFATYGEYLWEEFDNGKEEADLHNQKGLSSYLMEAKQKQVNMIRFDYEAREDMFDSHSYAKGGRILHMLRKYVGDEAFFKSLQLYLNSNKFKSVEIHNLRLAFEEVTGEDLNWFFNQWFLASGHPDLLFTRKYLADSKQVQITVKQRQDLSKTPLYKLPIDIDIYANGKTERHRIIINKAVNEFLLPCNTVPDLVNIDAEKMLLCSKKDVQSAKEFAFQYNNAPLYLDRYEALDYFSKNSSELLAEEILIKALDDKFWYIRQKAISYIRDFAETKKGIIKPKLMLLAQKDEKTSIRTNAMEMLSKLYPGDDVNEILKNGINDSSYAVVSTALYEYFKNNKEDGLLKAKGLERERNSDVLLSIANIYSEKGKDENNQFFINAAGKINGFEKYSLIMLYTKFLSDDKKEETVSNGLPVLEDASRNSGAWWMRLAGIQAISELANKYNSRAIEANLKAQEAQKTNPNESFIFQKQAESCKAMSEKLTALLNDIKKNEKDKNVTQFFGNN